MGPAILQRSSSDADSGAPGCGTSWRWRRTRWSAPTSRSHGTDPPGGDAVDRLSVPRSDRAGDPGLRALLPRTPKSPSNNGGSESVCQTAAAADSVEMSSFWSAAALC